MDFLSRELLQTDSLTNGVSTCLVSKRQQSEARLEKGGVQSISSNSLARRYMSGWSADIVSLLYAMTMSCFV